MHHVTRFVVLTLLAGGALMMLASAAYADHHHGLPHGFCVTVTLHPLSPPPTYQVCVPLPVP